MKIFTLDPTGYVGRSMTMKLAEHGHTIVGPAKDASFVDIQNSCVSCDAILLDLCAPGRESDLLALLAFLKDFPFETQGKQMILLGLSTVLTWNATQKNAKKSNKESNWKLRKSSPRYKEVRLLETTLLSCSKEGSIHAMVLAAGILYGNGEQHFHHLFKSAWMHAGESDFEGVPLIGDGKNVLPTLHVFDLVSILRILLESPPQEQQYFIGVDQGHTTQKQLVTAIANGIGDGKIKYVDKMDEKVLLAASSNISTENGTAEEDAAAAASSSSSSASATSAPSSSSLSSSSLLIQSANALTGGNPELILADMKFEAEWLSSQPLEWVSPEGPAASSSSSESSGGAAGGAGAGAVGSGGFDTLRQEYITARNLHPIRVFVTGGPCSGKSFYSEAIAKEFAIPHVRIQDILLSTLATKDEFAEKIQAALDASAVQIKNKNGGGGAGGKKGGKGKDKAANALANAGTNGQPSKSSNRSSSIASSPFSSSSSIGSPLDLSSFDSDTPRLSAYLLSKVMKTRLRRPEYRNKGYVLDGFPRTIEESRWFFSPDVEEDPETGEPIGKIEDKRAMARIAQALADEDGSAGGAGGEDAASSSSSDPIEAQLRDSTTMVDSVIFLSISEELASNRSKNLSHHIVGHDDQEGFNRRWGRFSLQQDFDHGSANPIIFIQDSIEILELSEIIAADTERAMKLIEMYCASSSGGSKGKGRPSNYHPTPEEQFESSTKARVRAEEVALAAKIDAQAKSTQEGAQRARYDSNASLRRAAVLLEDAMLIEASSLPIRNYLMQNVIPALVDGLLDVCKIQPEDPVDYLAEYLFKYSVDTPADAENAQERPKA